jgi:hypothetical protein
MAEFSARYSEIAGQNVCAFLKLGRIDDGTQLRKNKKPCKG